VSDIKTAIIYTRVSYSDQVEGTSLESQERFSREYAEQRGWDVLETFIEAGESAKTANRTELHKALVLCRRRKVDFFLVYKLDRFARNQDDHVTVRAMLRRYGTEVRSVTEPIDDSPMGRAMEGMLSVFAEFDNNMRRERCTQGMLERVKQGVWVWPAPLGYIRRGQGENISPDPDSAPLIRTAFKEFGSGVFNYRELSDLLNEQGLRTRNGKPINDRVARLIIKNPLYAGIVSVWGEEFEGSFTPLVSRELFEKCQRAPTAHAAPRGITNPLFPLRGLLICSECRRMLTASTPSGRGRKYPYYHHYFRGCSKSRSIPKHRLELMFVEYLNTLGLSTAAADSFKDFLMDKWKEFHRLIDEENAQLRKAMTLLEAERQRVFDLHRQGVYSDAEFHEQHELLDTRIKQKARRINGKADLDFDLSDALKPCFDFLCEPGAAWQKFEGDYRSQIILQREVFSGPIQFDREGFGNSDLSLLYRVVRDFQSEKSNLVDLLPDDWKEIIGSLRVLRGLLPT
jgi:site-specific DNA recombinase